MNLAHTNLKTSILTALIGLSIASGVFAAGSYVENFDSYNSISYVGQKSTTLANGAEIWGNNGSAASAVNIHQQASSWKAFRIAQDTTGGTIGTYIVGTVENPSTRVNSFTASFDLYLKNSSGDPADRFSFNFGNLTGSMPRDTESGLWISGQSGSMLSLVWDFYNNPTQPGEFVGTGISRGVELYRNGSLVSGTQVNSPVPILTNLDGSFTRINVRYDEEVNGGTFTFNTGGTVGTGNLISGGTDVFSVNNLGLAFAAGDQFAFSAATGGAEMDMFIDNVSIQTVPEPSSGALMALGIGGLMAWRRRK